MHLQTSRHPQCDLYTVALTCSACMQELYAALRSGQTDASSSQSPAELGSKKGSSGASVNELAGQVAGQVIQGAITQLNGSESSSQLMNHLTAAGMRGP